MVNISEQVTRHNLSSAMEFDHVIVVSADGTVADGPDNIYAPEAGCSNGDYLNPEIQRTQLDGPKWELMNGYSGQYLHRGPIMHPSEYIGGRMADDIRATPGMYVAIVVRDLDADLDAGDDDLAGWAVARAVEAD